MNKFQFPPLPEPDLHEGAHLRDDGKYLSTEDGYTVYTVEAHRKQIAKAVMLRAAELCDDYDGPDDELQHGRAEAAEAEQQAASTPAERATTADVFDALDLRWDQFVSEGGHINRGKLRAAFWYPHDYLPEGHWMRAARAEAAQPAEPVDVARDPRVLLAACLMHPVPLSLANAIKEVLAKPHPLAFVYTTPPAKPAEPVARMKLAEFERLRAMPPGCQTKYLIHSSPEPGDVPLYTAPPNLPTQALPSFEQVWAEKEAQGYKYGRDALEQVRFGWDIAMAAITAPPKD